MELNEFIQLALAEDIGDGDHSTLASIDASAQGNAKLLVKEAGVLAGLEIAVQIFKFYNTQLKIETFFKDGDKIKPGDIAFQISGSARSILTTERLVLNIMQRSRLRLCFLIPVKLLHCLDILKRLQ
jgi:nicotinate-nucleotide pyrophosphorylase (carboxylating)